MRRHFSNVRAVIGPYRKPPVSVAIARYRWAAMSRVHGTPSASMMSATSSPHAAADDVEPVDRAVHLVAEMVIDVDDEVPVEPGDFRARELAALEQHDRVGRTR